MYELLYVRRSVDLFLFPENAVTLQTGDVFL